MNYKSKITIFTLVSSTFIVSLLPNYAAGDSSIERYTPAVVASESKQMIVLEASKKDLQEAIDLEELSQKRIAPDQEGQTTSQIPKDSTNSKQISSKESIENYRQKYFNTSPISTEMIIRVSQHYSIPVSFILAVGHNESHMGTKGRAVQTMNPMNVGNTDAGDYKAVVCGLANNCLSGWEEGLSAFAALIRDCYFHDGESITLETWISRDFRAVRCGLEGKRYMTDPNSAYKYQERIKNLIIY